MSNFQILFDLIGELARRRYQAAEKSFATLGLNHTEARLLTLLHQNRGGATQDELGGKLTVDRTNAGRALQRLEQQGYILRRKDDTDKRANLVRLTDKGRRAVGEIGKLRRKIVQSFFGNLKEEEAGRVLELLKKAVAAGLEQVSTARKL